MLTEELKKWRSRELELSQEGIRKTAQ